MRIKLFEYCERRIVVSRPEGRYDVLRAGEEKRSRKCGHAFLPLDRTNGRIASREHDEISLETHLSYLGRLE